MRVDPALVGLAPSGLHLPGNSLRCGYLTASRYERLSGDALSGDALIWLILRFFFPRLNAVVSSTAG
jgi:hypothetical protein